MNYDLADGYVIAGIKSEVQTQQSNNYCEFWELASGTCAFRSEGKIEDRIFSIRPCKIMEKCDKITEIKYLGWRDTPPKIENPTIGKGEIDNLNSDSEASWTMTVGSTERKDFGDSETYIYSNGYETTNQMSIGASASVDILGFASLGMSTEVTTGTTRTTDETWERTKSKEISEEQTVTVSHQQKCPPRTLCAGEIIMTRAEVSVPYVIKLTNSITGEKCEEEGKFEKKQEIQLKTILHTFKSETEYKDWCKDKSKYCG